MEILTKIKEAIELVKNGHYHAAENIYYSLLEKNPEDIRVLPFLGWLYVTQGKYNEAIIVFKKVNNKTNNPNVITGLGISYYERGQYIEAYKYLKQSVDTNPAPDIFYKFITCACENSNQVEQTFQYAEKMNLLYPELSQTWDCYIFAALCAGKFEVAENYCRNLLAKHPHNAILYLSAGLIQEVVYLNYKLALECYLKSYELTPTTSALYNIGLAYSRLGQLKESETYLKKALERAPEAVEINKSLYLLYASQKEFTKAYNHFTISVKPLLNLFHSNWDGQDYINETLYIFGDQGMGDIIMYSRYLPLVKDKFKHVVVSVHPALIDLFKSNEIFSGIEFITHDTTVKYDKSTILTLLPKLLKLDYNNIPLQEGYLESNISIISEEIFNKTKDLKIGIVWEAGGVKLRGSLDRTLNPKLLTPIMTLPRVKFYSLQVNPAMDIKKFFSNIEDIGSQLRNFQYTADAIKNMDIIITVDTSVAHLAGAMGKHTLLMLPNNCDWRWFNANEGYTEWYKSIKIFKQPEVLDWDTVITQIKEALEELLPPD